MKIYQRAWNRNKEETETKAIELIDETNNFGSTSLANYLAEERIYLTKITVYRILVRKCKIRPKAKEKRVYQCYTLGYPGAEVQFDFTQLEVIKERLWDAMAIDDYTRCGFAMAFDRCRALNSITSLRCLIETAPFPVQTVITDQVKEVHLQFTKECFKLGLNHIRNRIKTPYHNDKVERSRRIREWCFDQLPWSRGSPVILQRA